MAKKPKKSSKQKASGSKAGGNTAARSKTAGNKASGTTLRQPCAALYNLDAGTPRGDAVRAVLDAQGIKVRTVDTSQLGNPVGAIMGLTGFKASTLPFTGEAPTCEFMLLDNVSSAKLNELLAAMREADCSVGCKAQVTQFNRLWPFATLVANVSREHEAMQQTTPAE